MTIVLYVVVVFLYWVALYLYVPTLPIYVESKTGSLSIVGVILSMYGLWQLIIRLPVGIAADWLGRRKPFIIIGLSLTGLGAWMIGAADGAPGLMAGRSTTGLAAATWVPFLVAFSALFPPQEAIRASVILTVASSLGRFLSMMATGWLNHLGGYSLAFFLAAGIAAMAVVIMLMVPEQRRPSHRPSPRSLIRLIKRREIMLPALLNAVNQYAEWSAIFGFLPILARQFGASDVTQSMLMSTYIGVFTVGNLVTTPIASRFGPLTLIYTGFSLLGAALMLAAWAASLWQLFVVYACIGLAFGATYPVLMGMSIQYVTAAERTTAMGLHQATYAIGMFGGPWISGLLASAISIQPTFGLTAFLCLGLGLVGARRLATGSPQSPSPK